MPEAPGRSAILPKCRLYVGAVTARASVNACRKEDVAALEAARRDWQVRDYALYGKFLGLAAPRVAKIVEGCGLPLLPFVTDRERLVRDPIEEDVPGLAPQDGSGLALGYGRGALAYLDLEMPSGAPVFVMEDSGEKRRSVRVERAEIALLVGKRVRRSALLALGETLLPAVWDPANFDRDALASSRAPHEPANRAPAGGFRSWFRWAGMV